MRTRLSILALLAAAALFGCKHIPPGTGVSVNVSTPVGGLGVSVTLPGPAAETGAPGSP